jgi:hypothetical protein
MTFFIVFGVFNRAGKSGSKIGIYALPPSKSEIYRFLLKLGLKFVPYTTFFKIYIIMTRGIFFPIGFLKSILAKEFF